jgi:hypothetical protein
MKTLVFIFAVAFVYTFNIFDYTVNFIQQVK